MRAALEEEARREVHPFRPREPKRQISATARRLVGPDAAGTRHLAEPGNVEAEAGAMAAEIAIAGVRDKTLIYGRPTSAAKRLNADELWACKCVVRAAAGEGDIGLYDDSLPADEWLARAFPCLSADERLRAGRWLACMASLGAEAPMGNETHLGGATVAERCLTLAGLSWSAWESLRMRESQFDTAQSCVTAARKRAVMGMLEERLWDRAFNGQREDSLTRAGEVVQVTKIDNNLAFNLLKYGHDQYARQMVKDKAAASAMTLMIAGSMVPQVPQVPQLTAKEPKTVEVIQ